MTRSEAIGQVVVVGVVAVMPVIFLGRFLKLPLFVPLLISFVIGFISLWLQAATERGKDEN